MLIREADPADAPGIARVHVDTWRSTYRGIVPDSFLDALSYEERESMWTRALTDPGSRSFLYVAEGEGEEIVGFACGGPSRSDLRGYEGELQAIYVLVEHQGKGIGRRLARAVAERLAAMGITSMLLWVFKDNADTRRFYETLGGQKLQEQQFELGGATLIEVGYGWSDTSILIGERA